MKHLFLKWLPFTCAICFLYVVYFPLRASEVTKANQFVLVIVPDMNATQGKMQQYERKSLHDKWHAIGMPKPVVIGQNGMAFVQGLNLERVKKEGDRRTPIGIFRIGPAFGFAERSLLNSYFEYIPIKDDTVCVDDLQSLYYNEIVKISAVSKQDWHSHESMHEISEYKHGSVIQYNTNNKTPGLGSCIFLHIWTNPHEGTFGCVAMSEVHMKELLSWLNDMHEPVIGLFPEFIYKEIRENLGLP